MPCFKPIEIHAPAPEFYRTVPCGRCLGCGLEYARNWQLRLQHEQQGHDDAYFLTLTYADEHLPASTLTGVATLVKSDLQKFYKRLRKNVGPCRHFSVGEYGDKTNRPHYHAILFGLPLNDLQLYGYSNGDPIYTSVLLDSTWQLGSCKIAAVTPASIAYVARYTLKKQRGPARQYYIDNDICPEFSLMSRKPGIGSKWYDEFKEDVYGSDVMYTPQGGKTRPPRYYDKLLERDDETRFNAIKTTRKLKQKIGGDASNKKRLADKEYITKQKMSHLQRPVD